MIQMATLSLVLLNKTFPYFHLKSSVGWIVLPPTNFTMVAVKLSCIYTTRNVREQ